jgi:acetyl-CoA synthetase
MFALPNASIVLLRFPPRLASSERNACSFGSTRRCVLLVYYIPSRRGVPVGLVYATGAFLAFAAAVHAGVLAEDPEDVVWAASDVAYLAAQSHGLWGPLVCGGTTVLYEGMIDTPTRARGWEIIERYRVNALFTTQPVLRKLHRWTDCHPDPQQLESLRIVVTGGEVRDAELHSWMQTQLAPGAIVTDAWGQAGTGAITWVAETSRRADSFPQPRLDVVDADGCSARGGVKGELVVRDPWPGTFTGFQNDDPDELARIWEHHRGVYATGDGAVRAADGTLAFRGRSIASQSCRSPAASRSAQGCTGVPRSCMDSARTCVNGSGALRNRA